MVFDLSLLQLLSFEIGTDCNLKSAHDNCPINYIKRPKNKPTLTVEKICEAVHHANDLKFDGYVAFHHYNEPLMYIKQISQVIQKLPNNRFLLWSNGLLIPHIERLGYSLDMFDKIILTCYDEKNRDLLNRVKDRHRDVVINSAKMDERVEIYESKYENLVACKKVFLEIPIDHYGEVALCTHDWKNTYRLGNIIETSLYDVISSERYQNMLAMAKKIKLQPGAPDICRNCQFSYLTYNPKAEE
ncbi:hypothetical protein UB51_00365 [Paenibacillus sp. IHBB 10380]|nr:hypothetical protein UB51_00365 [Paenibacillus sp. IHBB 10380]